jgi:hypothetical protein
MQRSKQQALMFLLGAVLVGGALGFSADRVMQDKQRHWGPRQRMYKDLELTESQQTRMDSLIDDRNCQISAIMKPIAPQIDAIRKSAHEEILAILNVDQRSIMERLRQEQVRKDSLSKARRDSVRAATKKAPTTCLN